MRVKKVRNKSPPAELIRFFPDLGPEQLGFLQQPACPGGFLARGRPPSRFIRHRLRQPLLNGRLERVKGGQGGGGVRLEGKSHRKRCLALDHGFGTQAFSASTTGRLSGRLRLGIGKNGDYAPLSPICWI